VCDGAGIVSVHRMSDDRELSRLPAVGSGAILPATFSSDGKWLAFTYADDRLRVWDWTKPALVLDVIKYKEGRDFQFAPNNRQLAIEDATNLVLYDLVNRGSTRAISPKDVGGVPQTPRGFRFGPSGRRVAVVVGAEGTNVVVLDTDSGNTLQSLPHGETIC